MQERQSMKLVFIMVQVLLTACLPNAAMEPVTPEFTATSANDLTGTETPGPERTAAPAGNLTGLEPGWWNEAVFYEIFVRSFKDSNGDGIGDFNGITEMLDYLNDGDPNTTDDLGITGIWLMPITQSNSYHGYDVVDYYSVDSDYGTKEDFLRLVDEAHKRGIRIIVDLVLNHTGIDHPWFKASNTGDPKYRDWYIWSPGNPGYMGPWGQQVWYPGKNGYYYAVFWSGMPDLNLKNPVVTQEIYNITEFWLTDMNVDGFRLDAIRHFIENGQVQENTNETHAWLQAYYKYYKSLDPSVFTVGEAWTDTANVVAYVGNQVDITFEFDLAEAYVRAANGPIASSTTTQLKTVLESYPPNQYGVFLTNHDQDRVMSVLGSDVQKARMAAVMLLTSPGVPFIYYGEEIGMTGAKPDEDIRRPMQWNGNDRSAGFTTGKPWRTVASDYPGTNVSTENADPDSLLNLYRELIQLRNGHASLRTGKTLILEAGTQRMLAVLRYDETEAFLILINVHSKPLTASLYGLSADAWPVPVNFKVSTVMGLKDPVPPQVNAGGGIAGYQPFVEIPAGSYTILHFTP
jgi:alpha-amylase